MKVFSKQDTKADISPEFREDRRGYAVKTHQVLNEWCTVKKYDHNEGESYFFMERKGVDSVAFILFDGNNQCPFGLIEQFRGNIGQFTKGCYTGSNDKPELTLEQITQEEVLEESGYTVSPDRIVYMSTEVCGSQSNERVHLYLVNVTGLTAGELQPESVFETNTNNLWVCEMGLLHSDDWKSKLIFHEATRLGIISKKVPITVVCNKENNPVIE